MSVEDKLNDKICLKFKRNVLKVLVLMNIFKIFKLHYYQ